MAFKIKDFATIRICFSNIQKSREWYKAFLGIEPIEDLENFVSFKVGSTMFNIALADPKNPQSTGGSIGYWLVDDLDEAIARAHSLEGQVYRGPMRVDQIKRTIVQIKDPHGNVIGLEAEY